MKKRISFVWIFLSTSLLLLSGLSGDNPGREDFEYDFLIKNARIFDGSLKPAFKADIAIKDGIIVKVERSVKGSAQKIINANKLYVAPGFIDLHAHVDRGMYFPENRACLNYLKQGVTTVVVGQCGRSAWPIFESASELIEHWSGEGIGPNAALLVGHGQVREMVMGMENREPAPEELEKMKSLVQEAMEQGAYGLSTGLEYLPGRYGKTDEVIELVKVIAPYRGIYHTHMRNEGERLLEAVNETIAIASESGARAHISHFKAVRKKNLGLVKDASALIEEARKNGLEITADQYPFLFSSGNPYRSLIPRSLWLGLTKHEGLDSEDLADVFDHLRDSQLLELYRKVTPYFPLSQSHRQFLDELPRKRLVQFVGGHLISASDFQGPSNTRERIHFTERMKDTKFAERAKKGIEQYIETSFAGPENVIVGICVEKKLEGKSLKQVATLKGKSIGEMAIELELMDAKCVPLRMSEEDVEYIMKKEYVATGSDGTTPFYGIGLPHIRSYSTFLHKIKKYALQRKSVSLPHVIRSQTSLAANIMNWEDRGWIKEGCKADIVVFDLDNIQIKTAISNPHQYSEGVNYLFINGVLVLDNGEYKNKLPGKVLLLKNSE
ncbi:MAG: amidohydrolase family protein [Candidatus Aminicenantes bacterium]|nr:MAG: amidohydrolase family protein [Candidatus Aminicenantes bacterium]